MGYAATLLASPDCKVCNTWTVVGIFAMEVHVYMILAQFATISLRRKFSLRSPTLFFTVFFSRSYLRGFRLHSLHQILFT